MNPYRALTLFIVLLGARATSGCLQSIDSSISGGTASAGSSGGTGGGTWDGAVCQNGYSIDPSAGPIMCTDNTNGGNQPIVTQTPGVELPDGGTTTTPCDLVFEQALEVRVKYCAGCHGHPGDPAAPFHTILDDQPLADGGASLMTGTSRTQKDDTGNPMRLIAPGDADHSYLYMRAANGSMPPPVQFGQTANVPTVSDISVLRSWIQSCLGGGGDTGGHVDAGGGDDGGTVGPVDATTGDDGGAGPADAGSGDDGGAVGPLDAGALDAGRPDGGKGADAGRIRDAGRG